MPADPEDGPALSEAALANLRVLTERGRDGPLQKEVFIAYDIENCPPPRDVPVEAVEKSISNAFQLLQRRKRAAFLTAVSPASHAAMKDAYGADQVKYLLAHIEHVLAPGGPKSASTDAKLIERIEGWLDGQAKEGKATTSVLVLITGDDDFTKVVRQAMHAGMDVEVLHPRGATSANLLTTISGRASVWHHDWISFLEFWLRQVQGVQGLPPRLEVPRLAPRSEGARPAKGKAQKGGKKRGAEAAAGSGERGAKRLKAPQTGGGRAAGGMGDAADGNRRRKVVQQQAAGAAAPAGVEAQVRPAPPQAAAAARGAPAAVVVTRRLAAIHVRRLTIVATWHNPAAASVAACAWLQRHHARQSVLFQRLCRIAEEQGCTLRVATNSHVRIGPCKSQTRLHAVASRVRAALEKAVARKLQRVFGAAPHSAGGGGAQQLAAKSGCSGGGDSSDGSDGSSDTTQHGALPAGNGTSHGAGADAGGGGGGLGGAGSLPLALQGVPCDAGRVAFRLVQLSAVRARRDRCAAVRRAHSWLRGHETRNTRLYRDLHLIAKRAGCRLHVRWSHGGVFTVSRTKRSNTSAHPRDAAASLMAALDEAMRRQLWPAAAAPGRKQRSPSLGPKRAAAVCVSRLAAVRRHPDPDGAEARARAWLLEQAKRKTKGPAYRRLQQIALDAGCRMEVDGQPGTRGRLLIARQKREDIDASPREAAASVEQALESMLLEVV